VNQEALDHWALSRPPHPLKKKKNKQEAPDHDWSKLSAPLPMLQPTSITQALSSHFTFTSAMKLTGVFKNFIISFTTCKGGQRSTWSQGLYRCWYV